MITIRGEEGKSLGPSEIDFSSIASSGFVDFQSLGVDELRFVIEPKFLDAREAEIPQGGQSVSLFIAGERVFSGVVTRIRNQWGSGSLDVEVTVSGPWWWLEQTALSDIVGEGENAAERPQFRCSLGQVESHLQRLFARMQDLGLPVSLGDVDSCYQIPTTTFQDVSFGRAISELLRLVPDAVGWWDYSGTGNPSFRVSRRNPDEAETITLGSDPVLSGTIEAEFSLQIERVSIPYAERLESGEISYKELSAGSGSGTRQVLPVSGPELVDFVPPDPIDGVTISTIDLMSSPTQVDPAAVRSVWPFWVEWLDRNSGAGQSGRVLDDWSNISNPPLDFYTEGVVPKVYLEDGTELDGATDNNFAIVHVPGQEIPEWIEEVVTVQRGYVRGTFWTEQDDIVGADPQWMTELVQEATLVRTEIGGPDNGDRILFFDLDVPVILLPTELASVTLYKPLAYTFETPPQDFAKNLQEAQNWLPYTGNINLELESPPFVRRTGKTINVANGRKDWESMGALVQGESLDLFALSHSLSLGLPERLSGSTPVTRLERASSDSIILL